MPMRTYTTILAGSSGITPLPTTGITTTAINYLQTMPTATVLGSQNFVGVGALNQFIASSSIGTTNAIVNPYTLPSTASTPLGFAKIENCNSFSVQVNVGIASTAAGFGPAGTFVLKASVDGVNYSNFPSSSLGRYNGNPTLVFSSTGAFNMIDYQNPGFNYIKLDYTAGSSSATSIWSAVLSSKTYS